MSRFSLLSSMMCRVALAGCVLGAGVGAAHAVADLTVGAMDSPDPVATGGVLTYTVGVFNFGPTSALDVVVTSGLPGGVTFLSTSGGPCAEDPNGVPICSLGSIAAGGSRQYTIAVRADFCSGSGTRSLTVTVTSATPDPNPGNNSAVATTSFIDPGTCDDGDLCTTNDACSGSVCAGVPRPCEDANTCTIDACVAGSCVHTPKPAGTACGDQADTECTDPDTCDAGGNCDPNHEPAGTLCGDSSDSECDNRDTCDGAGSCGANYEPAGTACGSPTNDECTDPDTCDGAGTCQRHDQPDGTGCACGIGCGGVLKCLKCCVDGACEQCGGPQVTWYVPGDGSNTCAAANPSCSTIQGAIDAAGNLDTIEVAAGTYPEDLVLAKRLRILGARAGVDACGRVGPESAVTGSTPTGPRLRLLDCNGADGSIIDGLTFSGGTRTIESGSGPLDEIQLLNNRIEGFAESGVFLDHGGANFTASRNRVDGTGKTGAGGSWHLGDGDFDGFQFTDNCIVHDGPPGTFAPGFGFFADGDHSVGPTTGPGGRPPVFAGNLIERHGTGASLGRFAFELGTIGGNRFARNDLDGLQGGIQSSSISGNLFEGNGRHGLSLTGLGSPLPDAGARSNSVTQNCFDGNGLSIAGGGLFFGPDQPPGTISTNHANENSFRGNFRGAIYDAPGTEIIDAENNFWGAATGPTNPGNPGGTGDPIETPNASGGVIDFGPFGVCPTACSAADCNGNGVPDECDISGGTSPDCNGNGVPDECDISGGTSPDCNGNGVPDECDVAFGSSTDCEPDGIPDECGTDCNNNGVPDFCDIRCGCPPNPTADCQPNGIPDECEPDCDSDGVPDDCEDDCDLNGTPDDCEVIPDCNGNGRSDFCDTGYGLSPDCQPNWIPDECEADCDGDGIPDDCDSANCDDANPCTVDTCNGGACSSAAGNAGAVCRAAAASCDTAETCDGVGVSCPADAFQPATTVCRASAGVCDQAETCFGDRAACPADIFQLAGTVCRASAGVCDVPETCSGTAAACPDDASRPDGTPCGDAGTECVNPDSCIAGSCQDNGFKAAGTACGVSSVTECTDPDTCDGAGTCLPNDQPDGIPCTRPCPGVPTCQGGLCTGGDRPPEVGNLRFLGDNLTLAWDPAGSGELYDVVRGIVRELPVGGGAAETCLASGISESTAVDAAEPTVGESFWYLARARNSCGPGSFGFSSQGSPRVTAVCPDPLVFLGGSAGDESEADAQTVLWSADPDQLIAFLLQVRRGTELLFASSDPQGTFSFDPFGTGLFDIQAYASYVDLGSATGQRTEREVRQALVYGPEGPAQARANLEDPDHDGLTTGEELALGTIPASGDTDADGLADGQEVRNRTSPLLADTDGDTLSDKDESDFFTDPRMADTDEDGISDDAELAAGTDPRLYDPSPPPYNPPYTPALVEEAQQPWYDLSSPSLLPPIPSATLARWGSLGLDVSGMTREEIIRGNFADFLTATPGLFKGSESRACTKAGVCGVDDLIKCIANPECCPFKWCVPQTRCDEDTPECADDDDAFDDNGNIKMPIVESDNSGQSGYSALRDQTGALAGPNVKIGYSTVPYVEPSVRLAGKPNLGKKLRGRLMAYKIWFGLDELLYTEGRYQKGNDQTTYTRTRFTGLSKSDHLLCEEPGPTGGNPLTPGWSSSLRHRMNLHPPGLNGEQGSNVGTGGPNVDQARSMGPVSSLALDGGQSLGLWGDRFQVVAASDDSQYDQNGGHTPPQAGDFGTDNAHHKPGGGKPSENTQQLKTAVDYGMEVSYDGDTGDLIIDYGGSATLKYPIYGICEARMKAGAQGKAVVNLSGADFTTEFYILLEAECPPPVPVSAHPCLHGQAGGEIKIILHVYNPDACKIKFEVDLAASCGGHGDAFGLQYEACAETTKPIYSNTIDVCTDDESQQEVKSDVTSCNETAIVAELDDLNVELFPSPQNTDLDDDGVPNVRDADWWEGATADQKANVIRTLLQSFGNTVARRNDLDKTVYADLTAFQVQYPDKVGNLDPNGVCLQRTDPWWWFWYAGRDDILDHTPANICPP